jgi:Predicted membrane protein (DUF2207)
MDLRIFGDLDLGTLEPLVAAAGLVSALLWLALVAFVYAFRSPPRPDPGPGTLELGPEPPALANFLVNDFRVTDEALPATVLDLAARRLIEIEQRGPGEFYVRMRPTGRPELQPYEERALRHLGRLASAGVVPARALTTGPEAESKPWREAFRGEVVADAQGRGLSQDALDSRIWSVLIVLAAIPAAGLWAAWGIAAAVAFIAGAALLLGWLASRHPQRETPAGLGAAARWLGVRAELATNEVFPTYTPLAVPLWDRLLAYGAALGVAPAASNPLPMGVESDTRAWSSQAGSWREVRISYPRMWPPGWGSEPTTVLAVGVAVAAVAGLLLYTTAPSLSWALVGTVGALGAVAALIAASDWYTSVEVTGPIIRARVFENDDEKSYYVAVDDGVSPSVRAFRVSEEQYGGLRQGQVVTVRATARLGRVRWIVRESDATRLGAP